MLMPGLKETTSRLRDRLRLALTLEEGRIRGRGSLATVPAHACLRINLTS